MAKAKMAMESWHPLDGMAVGKALGLTFAMLHLAGRLIDMGTNGALMGTIAAWHGVSVTLVAVDLTTIVVGTIAAFVSGLVAGWLFARIWNMKR